MRVIWPRKPHAAWTPLSKPLSQSTLALVCSNAYPSGAWKRLGPFEYESRFRSISADGHSPEPVEAHSGDVDHAQREDERLLAVLARVRPLVDSGRLGRLSARHLSLSGAVVSSRRLIAVTRRAALPPLSEDRVDVVLLVPT